MIEIAVSRPFFGSLLASGVRVLAASDATSQSTLREAVSITTLQDGGLRVMMQDPITMQSPELRIGVMDILLCRTRQVFDRRLASLQRWGFLRGRSEGVCAWILVGTGSRKGRIAGFARAGEESPTFAADRIYVTGPAMERVLLRGEGLSQPWPNADEVWSRSQGAMGRDAWTRLASDRMLIVGAGRTGSLLAMAVANLGVRDITIVDPDRIEPHNIDGGPLFGFDDLGRPKVDALAGRLEALCPWARFTAIARSVGSSDGIEAVKRADTVLVAVDSVRSLVQVHALCRVYGRTLVTVGTRIDTDEMGRDVAIDIGLFYGGLPGCCRCMGGDLPNYHAARKDLAHLPEDDENAAAVARVGDFRNERAGSLLSINAVAAGTALYLLQSAYGGGAAATQRSGTTRLHFDLEGNLQTRSEYSSVRHLVGECLCSMMNTGDEGLRLLRAYGERSRLSFSRRWR